MSSTCEARPRPGRARPPARVAVVVSGWPRLSETFALNELLALHRAGMLAGVFATKPGESGLRHPAARRAGADGDRASRAGTRRAARPRRSPRASPGPARPAVHGYFAHRPGRGRGGGRPRCSASRTGSASTPSTSARSPPAELADRAAGARASCWPATPTSPPTRRRHRRPAAAASRTASTCDAFRATPPTPAGRPRSCSPSGRFVEKKGFGDLLAAVAPRSTATSACAWSATARCAASSSRRSRRLGLERPGRAVEPRRTHDALPACYAARRRRRRAVGRRRDRRPGRAAQRRARGDGQRPAGGGQRRRRDRHRACATASPGRLVPPGDADALAAAITELVDRPDLRRAYGARGPRPSPRPEFALGGLHRGVLHRPGGGPMPERQPSATCSRATRGAPSCSSPARSGGWSSSGSRSGCSCSSRPTRSRAPRRGRPDPRPSRSTCRTPRRCPGGRCVPLAAREPRRRSVPALRRVRPPAPGRPRPGRRGGRRAVGAGPQGLAAADRSTSRSCCRRSRSPTEVERAGDVATPARALRPRHDHGDLAGGDDLRPAVLVHRARQGHLPRVAQPGRPARAASCVRRRSSSPAPRANVEHLRRLAPRAAGPPRLPRPERRTSPRCSTARPTGRRDGAPRDGRAARGQRRAAGAEEGLRRAASTPSPLLRDRGVDLEVVLVGRARRRDAALAPAGRRARPRRRRRAAWARAARPSCCGSTARRRSSRWPAASPTTATATASRTCWSRRWRPGCRSCRTAVSRHPRAGPGRRERAAGRRPSDPTRTRRRDRAGWPRTRRCGSGSPRPGPVTVARDFDALSTRAGWRACSRRAAR